MWLYNSLNRSWCYRKRSTTNSIVRDNFITDFYISKIRTRYRLTLKSCKIRSACNTNSCCLIYCQIRRQCSCWYIRFNPRDNHFVCWRIHSVIKMIYSQVISWIESTSFRCSVSNCCACERYDSSRIIVVTNRCTNLECLRCSPFSLNIWKIESVQSSNGINWNSCISSQSCNNSNNISNPITISGSSCSSNSSNNSISFCNTQFKSRSISNNSCGF